MSLTYTNITSPVGIRNSQTTMANTPRDLAIVTDLFDRIPMANGGSAERFGVWAINRDDLIAEVTAQIITFQTANGLPVIDGVIDPGGGTLKLMNTLAEDRLITRMPGEPAWEDWGHKALGSPHLGIGWPAGVTRPSAYLIYFHHSIGQEAADYASAEVRFKKGIGDYLIGRMRGLDQISWSGKNVCMVVPEPTWGGQGVFDSNEPLVTEVLKEIDADLTGGESRELPPLLVASYSDGLGRLNNFMNSCPNLRRLVRGAYDFDGLYVKRLSDITLAGWA